jgi:ATP-binding cassette, subfamily C, bacterial
MSQFDVKRGAAELAGARRDQRPLLVAAFIFSIFINALNLTGSLYMLQVYDRVLGARSEHTLLALTILVAFLFLAMGLIDHSRGRVMARIGARMQEKLDRRVFSAALRRLSFAPGDPAATAAQRDLESVQRLWSSPILSALFDIPWTPFYIAAIFIFHPWLGYLSILGGAILITMTWANQSFTKQPLQRTNSATLRAEMMSDSIKQESEVVQALGMTEAAFDRWQVARGAALAQGIAAADLAGGFSTASRTFRLFLQSAMLGLGAYLVLQNQLSSGAMIAASILMGRALAPVEQAIGQWALVTRAQEGWARLSDLLSKVPPEPVMTALPRPRAVLEAQNLTVVPPGEQQAVLRMVSFRLEPGQALGVIGPSGAGKSTLARALIGAWRPAAR